MENQFELSAGLNGLIGRLRISCNCLLVELRAINLGGIHGEVLLAKNGAQMASRTEHAVLVALKK